MSDNLAEKLDEVLTPADKENEKHQGIWYWVYLRPEWKLYAWPFGKFGELGHIDVWSKYVVPLIMDHYKLSEDKRQKLEKTYYAFPRGRICYAPQGIDVRLPGEEPGNWYIYHGGNTPGDSKDEVEAHRREVLNAFGLNQAAARGLVHWKITEHESNLKEHVEKCREMIGEVIYGSYEDIK